MKITNALTLAYFFHLNQRRKGTDIPYFVHLMDVASNLMKSGADEDLIVAGVLHDTLEDTTMTKEFIKDTFGENVLKLVLSNSEEKEHDASPEEKVSSWKERKSHTMDRIKEADENELLLITADKLANLRDIYYDFLFYGDDFWKRFNASREDIKWYYSSIIEAVRTRLKPSRMLLELEDIYKRTFES